MAKLDYQRAETAVAAAWVQLALRAEQSWYTAGGAAQVARMRDLVAQAASVSAELAQRYLDAGNIPRIDFERARAEADAARIDALRARAHAERARVTLADRLGIAATDGWRLPERLPAPPAHQPELDALRAQAMHQRLDRQAAQQTLTLGERAATHTRHWGWLGDSELEYEREREPDGEKRGPGIRVPIPLFDHGQARRARAQARLDEARITLATLDGQIDNAVRLGVAKLNAMNTIASIYRDSLVPARERVVARAQENQHYGFIGAFELIIEQRETYDAYQDYLESVRDYWIARSELRAAVGGHLPDDDALPEQTLSPDELLDGVAR
jgi:cobalt-zinc-cadmium efflux system outer membrane protein